MTEMKKPINQLLITSLLLFILPVFVQANVKLPVLVSDGMVLQRDTKINNLGMGISRRESAE